MARRQSTAARAVAGLPAQSTHDVEPMPETAYLGPWGDAALTLAQTTEAAPESIYGAGIGFWSAAIGPGPRLAIGDRRRCPRSFILLVGRTGSGRKDSAWDAVERLGVLVDPTFVHHRCHGGFGSGQSLIDNLRGKGGEDEPPEDVRFCWIETEFGRTLAAASNSATHLSPILRQAWDGGRLVALARGASGGGTFLPGEWYHLSMVAMVTPDDLRTMPAAELLNGWANRYIILWSYRGQRMGWGAGGGVSDAVLRILTEDMRTALRRARMVGMMSFDRQAQAYMDSRHIDGLSSDDPLIAAMEVRDLNHLADVAAQSSALSGLSTIPLAHVEAAAEVVAYGQRTKRYLWLGGGIGEEDTPFSRRLAKLAELLRTDGGWVSVREAWQRAASHEDKLGWQHLMDTAIAQGWAELANIPDSRNRSRPALRHQAH